MEVRIDDLSGPEVALFLEEHLRDMRDVSPPESKHALDLDGLRQPDITFWTVWEGTELIGCGAMKELDKNHAGVASMLLSHMLREARLRGYHRLSLETGSMPFFEPARRLYSRHGFSECAPFAAYREDPNSIFMTLALEC